MSKGFLETVAGQFGDVLVGREKEVKNWIDTGSFALNRIISGDYLKGYPTGKIVELFGEPGTGKSFFIYKAIANFQAQFGKDAACILDDTEEALSENLKQMHGIDSNRLLQMEPSSATVEDHFRSMFLGRAGTKGDDEDGDGGKKKKREGLVPLILKENSKAQILLALDSVAALSTEHEKKVGLDKSDMTKAKMIKSGIRQSWPLISSNDVLYIIANHVYDVVTAYIPTKATPGGKGIPFMSSVRIEFTARKKTKDSKGAFTGQEFEAFVRKNKVAPPYKRAALSIDFKTGIDRMFGIAELLLEDGYFEKKSAGWYYIDKERKVRESDITEEFLFNLLKGKDKEPKE
jgi:RecA/RadA recombinase